MCQSLELRCVSHSLLEKTLRCKHTHPRTHTPTRMTVLSMQVSALTLRHLSLIVLNTHISLDGYLSEDIHWCNVINSLAPDPNHLNLIPNLYPNCNLFPTTEY